MPQFFSLEYWIGKLLTLPAILLAISMHEFAHGFVSAKLGDPTPRATGRLSFNPLAHIDWVGALCLFFFGFGWAKPVQIDPRYYKHKKLGIILVSLAGVIMNFILAFLLTFVCALMIRFVGPLVPETEGAVRAYNILYMMVYYGVTINIGLGVFNLIPIPPLDGSKVLFAVLPNKYYNFILKYERYGMIILVLLLFTDVLTYILTPCSNFIFNLFAQAASFIL